MKLSFTIRKTGQPTLIKLKRWSNAGADAKTTTLTALARQCDKVPVEGSWWQKVEAAPDHRKSSSFASKT